MKISSFAHTSLGEILVTTKSAAKLRAWKNLAKISPPVFCLLLDLSLYLPGIWRQFTSCTGTVPEQRRTHQVKVSELGERSDPMSYRDQK